MGTAAVVPRAPHCARCRRGRTARGRHSSAVLSAPRLKIRSLQFFFLRFLFTPRLSTPHRRDPRCPPPPQHRGSSKKETGEQKREGSARPRGAGTRGDFRSFDRSSVPSFAEASNKAFFWGGVGRWEGGCPRTHSPENISHLLKYSRVGLGDARLRCALIYRRN